MEGTLLPSQVDQFLKELGQQRLELQAQIEVTLQSSRQREMSQRELEDERDDLERQIRKLQRDIDRARENKGGGAGEAATTARRETFRGARKQRKRWRRWTSRGATSRSVCRLPHEKLACTRAAWRSRRLLAPIAPRLPLAHRTLASLWQVEKARVEAALEQSIRY